MQISVFPSLREKKITTNAKSIRPSFNSFANPIRAFDMRSVSSICATARGTASSAALVRAPWALSAPRCQRRGAAIVAAAALRRSLLLSFVGGPRPTTTTTDVATRAAAESSSPADAELAGQITAEIMENMRLKIADALETEAASVRVADVSGDGRHVAIDVIAAAFEGKKSMERQRMVYKAIWQELAETVHAVDAMTTKTPAEAGQ